MSDNILKAFEDYIGKKESTVVAKIENKDNFDSKPNDYTYTPERDNQILERLSDRPVTSRQNFVAQDAVQDLDTLARLIEATLNAAWGSDWGAFHHSSEMTNMPEEIVFPLITYDIVFREPKDKTNPGGQLMHTVAEVVDGKKTGETFQIYKRWFDCVVEFNIWGESSKQCIETMNRFEALILSSTGFYKKKGVSQMAFLKEQPGDSSSKYNPDVPMRSLLYYVGLESTITVKSSLLRKIELELDAIV